MFESEREFTEDELDTLEEAILQQIEELCLETFEGFFQKENESDSREITIEVENNSSKATYVHYL